MCHIPIRVGVDAAYFRHYQYRLAVCMVPFCQEGDRIKTARYAERHLSLSLPIHVLVVSTHYATQPIENLYLNMAAKIIMVAGLYALVLWKLQSTIFRESIEFLLKKKEHEPHSLYHIRL